MLQFVISLLIVGAFLVIGQSGYRTARTLSTSLLGDSGHQLTDLSIETIRSVAKGVLGVALIQAILAGLGCLVVGVPAAGLWALIVLLLAVIQLPTILIMGPIIVYVFYTTSSAHLWQGKLSSAQPEAFAIAPRANGLIIIGNDPLDPHKYTFINSPYFNKNGDSTKVKFLFGVSFKNLSSSFSHRYFIIKTS